LMIDGKKDGRDIRNPKDERRSIDLR